MNDINIHFNQSKKSISIYINLTAVYFLENDVDIKQFIYENTPIQSAIQSFLNKHVDFLNKETNTYDIPAEKTLDFIEYISKQHDIRYIKLLSETIPVLCKSSEPFQDLQNIYIYKKHDIYNIKFDNQQEHKKYLFIVENNQEHVYSKTIETENIKDIIIINRTNFEFF